MSALALQAAIGGVLFNVSNFPERVQSRLLGQDTGPLNAKLTTAVLNSQWLTQHDAEVRADQREQDALVAVSMADNEVDGYYGQACSEIARSLREGRED